MFESKLEAFRKQNCCIYGADYVAFFLWHLWQRKLKHSSTFPFLEIWGSSLRRGALCCYFQKQWISPNNLTFAPLLTTCFRKFWHFMNLYRPRQDNKNLMFLEHYWFSLWFSVLASCVRTWIPFEKWYKIKMLRNE